MEGRRTAKVRRWRKRTPKLHDGGPDGAFAAQPCRFGIGTDGDAGAGFGAGDDFGAEDDGMLRDVGGLHSGAHACWEADVRKSWQRNDSRFRESESSRCSNSFERLGLVQHGVREPRECDDAGSHDFEGGADARLLGPLQADRAIRVATQPGRDCQVAPDKEPLAHDGAEKAADDVDVVASLDGADGKRRKEARGRKKTKTAQRRALLAASSGVETDASASQDGDIKPHARASSGNGGDDAAGGAGGDGDHGSRVSPSWKEDCGFLPSGKGKASGKNKVGELWCLADLMRARTFDPGTRNTTTLDIRAALQAYSSPQFARWRRCSELSVLLHFRLNATATPAQPAVRVHKTLCCAERSRFASSVVQLAGVLGDARCSNVEDLALICDVFETFTQCWPEFGELSLLNVDEADPCELPFTVLVAGAAIQNPRHPANVAFLELFSALGMSAQVRNFISQWSLGLAAVAKIEALPTAAKKVVLRGFQPRGAWHSFSRTFLAYAESVERNWTEW